MTPYIGRVQNNCSHDFMFAETSSKLCNILRIWLQRSTEREKRRLRRRKFSRNLDFTGKLSIRYILLQRSSALQCGMYVATWPVIHFSKCGVALMMNTLHTTPKESIHFVFRWSYEYSKCKKKVRFECRMHPPSYVCSILLTQNSFAFIQVQELLLVTTPKKTPMNDRTLLCPPCRALKHHLVDNCAQPTTMT